MSPRWHGADRLPRSTVLVGSNVIGGVAQAVAAVLLLSGEAQVWHLVVLEAVNATGFALFHPADSALVPLTVPEDHLREANALLGLGTNVTLTDLRDGWSEFIAHRWLWSIVAQFSVKLLGFFGAFLVLGPVEAERDLSGASSWASIVGGQSAGLLAGGLVALR